LSFSWQIPFFRISFENSFFSFPSFFLQSLKRKLEEIATEDAKEEKEPSSKRQATSSSDDLEDLLKLVDEAPEVCHFPSLVFDLPHAFNCHVQVKELDSTQLKQLLSRFEKAVHTNVEMRVKYSDDAKKFVFLLSFFSF
jgi:hypothetical protein